MLGRWIGLGLLAMIAWDLFKQAVEALSHGFLTLR